MVKIKAAVARNFGAPWEIEEIELRAPRAGEVEVAVEACAICHSDISYADGIWGGILPAIYGHEAAGRISSVGAGVTGYAVGERVIVTLLRACGRCGCCATGTPYHCETSVPPEDTPFQDASGRPVDQAMKTGAFAERIVVDTSQIARVPDDMPSEAACLLSCGVITGIGAVVNAAGLRAGQDAVVIGAGGVGLNAIQGAQIAGARRIVAVDIAEDKLADAREFGATDTLLSDDAAPARLRDLLGRGADAVFVTTGAIQAFDAAPDYLGVGGKMVLVGMPPVGAKASYEAVNVAFAGQHLIGSKMGNTVLSRDIPWLVDLWRQGRLHLEPLISRRWTLDQINEAVADTRAGNARRNVVVFG